MTLLTSLPPERPAGWRSIARGWGIENGLHARLDTSRRDDQCRLHATNAVWVHDIFERLANSLFMEWRSHRNKPRHFTTTDFAARMSADHTRRAVSAVTAHRPNLKSLS